jgi:hypothetical protein
MESPKFYRQRAEDMRAKAADEVVPIFKEQFTKIARNYDTLADQLQSSGNNRDKWHGDS